MERNLVSGNEKDGTFTIDSVADLLKKAMVSREGKSVRNNAKEMVGLFGKGIRNDKYIYVEYCINT